jgi:hypothetical protein
MPRDVDQMSLIQQIEVAFESRARPREVTPRWHPDTSEYEEALRFKGQDWKALGATFLRKNSDALYALTPDAFCYYLPAFLIAGVGVGQDAIFLAGGIVGMLDRSPNPEFWDDFFLTRWCALKKPECLAIQEWLLSRSDDVTDRENDELSRAFDTVQLLIKKEEQ